MDTARGSRVGSGVVYPPNGLWRYGTRSIVLLSVDDGVERRGPNWGQQAVLPAQHCTAAITVD